jgi:heme-degrading monooxygenase HmoA
VINIIWSFRVRRGLENEFASAYGPQGEWAALFAQAEGYRGTKLLKDDGAQRYVTIDAWDSLEHFERFKERYHQQYITLDARFESFTELEEPIGVFEVVE